jgi:hypothetical protein
MPQGGVTPTLEKFYRHFAIFFIQHRGGDYHFFTRLPPSAPAKVQFWQPSGDRLDPLFSF